MKLSILNANEHGPLSLSRLADFERRAHVQLPNDYRQFLLEYNGGRPEPAFFWIQRPVDGSRVYRFYAIFEGSQSPSLYTYAGQQRYGIPPGLLPIADDGVGNWVCIGTAASAYGEIFFLDHDRFSPRAAKEQQGVIRLAGSFTEFLLSLMEDPR